MARNYEFAPLEYYHLYARGVEKLPVVREPSDAERFLESLYVLNTSSRTSVRNIKDQCARGLPSGASSSVYETVRSDCLVDIGMYCLMENHFHIVVCVREDQENGVSKFMQKLMTSYTMYINKKYDRTGALFGSSFKARHVTNDRHLRFLYAYIHLNPRKACGGDLRRYKYSSYHDYCAVKRPEGKILNPNAFPDYFAGKLEQELETWLNVDLL